MEPEVRIGVVWPGPPGPGDIDEVSRFVPSRVNLRVTGTRPEQNIPSGITPERAIKLAESSHIEEAAREIAGEGVQAIAYACTSASYVRGIGGDRDIADRITAATGIPATTTSSAAVLALREREVRRVAVLSPHVDSLNARLGRFLHDSEFDVVAMHGLNMLGGIEKMPAEEVYDIAMSEFDRVDADGIFISCTGVRTADVLGALEEATGKPVVTANQATIWDVCRLAGRSTELTVPAPV